MKNLFLILFYLSALFVLGSCSRFTFEKRKYEKGFYVNFSKKINSSGNDQKKEKLFYSVFKKKTIEDKTENQIEAVSIPQHQKTSAFSPYFFSVLQKAITNTDTVPPKKDDKKQTVQTLHEPDGKGKIGYLSLLLIIVGAILFGLAAIPGLIILLNIGLWGILLSICTATYSRFSRDKETVGSYAAAKITVLIFLGLLAAMGVAVIAILIITLSGH